MVPKGVACLLVFLACHLTLRAWVTPFSDQIQIPGDPIVYEFEPLHDHVTYIKRTNRNLVGTNDEDRVLFEAALRGEIRITARGFAPGTYRLEFGHAEMRAHSRFNRFMDIRVNGTTVIPAYNAFEKMGMFTAGIVTAEVTTTDGAFTIEYRKSNPQNEEPRFCFVRFVAPDGDEVSLFSALRLEPPDYAYAEYAGQMPSVVDNSHEAPPFAPSYKIRAGETERLTPADIVGPDGIVYPNWTRVGIEGGIPEVGVVVRLRDFGALPDSGVDASEALTAAAAAAGEAGGGAVLLESGTYLLDRPVFVRHDGVVIRGAGRDRTKILFRYAPPERGVDVFTLADPGGVMGPSSQLFAAGHEEELRRVALEVDGELLSELTDLPVGTYQFMTYAPGWRILDRFGAGTHTVTAIAEYYSGEVSREEREMTFVEGARHENQLAFPGQLAAINFVGGGPLGSMIPLTADATRGSTSLDLAAGHGLRAGDRITVHAPATERWKTLVRCAAPWGDYRRAITRVTAVDGNRITVEDPLRIEFPIIDGSYVQAVDFQDRCGVEDLAIEQTQRLWTNGVFFVWAWESWVQRVDVTLAGRHPVYLNFGKRCEIRDCEFDRTWYDLGGGTSYIGFERDYECLMENVTTRQMRHGPLVQWASSGNVFRNCHFIGSDAQYHAGWTHENLFENCVVDSSYENGSYGYGIYSSSPEAGFHGPTGPRNVVYNCDITGPSVGFWMGGMNENFIVAYNRFIVGKGPAIAMKHASFDHIIRGNVFVVHEPWPAVFYLGTRDCLGVELIDNTVIGPVSVLVTGQARPLVERGTVVRRHGNIERPQPAVPSIYAWQQMHGMTQLAWRIGKENQP
ncbi:MAG: right-handed parallel beta-helix repeat-containing protein [Opitutaceae bacterium]